MFLDKEIVGRIKEDLKMDKSMAAVLAFLQSDKNQTPAKIKEQMSDYCLMDNMLMYEQKIYVPQNHLLQRDIVELRHNAITAGHPEGRWIDVTYDFIVKLPVTPRKNNSILVVVNRFTKQAHFIATKEASSAKKMAKMFLENIWKLHRTPLQTIADQGTTFNSESMKRLYESIGIKPSFLTAYHSQTDGQLERINSLMEQYLRLYINYRQDDWDEWLAIAKFQYNNTVSLSTSVTPFYTDQGRHPMIVPQMFNETKVPAAEKMAMKIKEIGEEVKAMLKKVEERHRNFYDCHTQQATPHQVRDHVWLNRKDSITGTKAIKTLRPSAKLEHRRFRPYKAVEKVGRSAYQLELPDTLRIHPVFHVSRLIATLEDPIQGHMMTPPPPVQNEDGEEEYKVK
ncbi:hypothetical protein FRB97_005797 [Tulasnella sp. 331]|nr:hypothetical protein FRB97_005797 [Tulasnella sp. 331]